MRRVCICFCGFLETREHSFICNCHPQLIIAWYVLYINNVTHYTQSSGCQLGWSPPQAASARELWPLCSFPKLQGRRTQTQRGSMCVPASQPTVHSFRDAQHKHAQCKPAIPWLQPGSQGCTDRGGRGHTSRYLNTCQPAETGFWVLAVAGTAV